MRVRKLTALVAVVGAAVAVVGLAGCGSRIGTAAIVSGHRISDSAVGRYLTPQAKPFTVSGQNGASQTIVPRSYTLTVLIQNRLFTEALTKTKGGVPSDGDVSAVEAQLTQGASQAKQEQEYTRYGFTASFAAVDLRNTALEEILAKVLGVTTDLTPLLTAVHDLHANVQVSARYGTWNDSGLSIDFSPSAGAPSFVKLAGPTAAARAPRG